MCAPSAKHWIVPNSLLAYCYSTKNFRIFAFVCLFKGISRNVLMSVGLTFSADLSIRGLGDGAYTKNIILHYSKNLFVCWEGV